MLLILNFVILAILCLNTKTRNWFAHFMQLFIICDWKKSIWNLSRTDGIRIVLHLNKTIFWTLGENTRQISVLISRAGSHTPGWAQLISLWLQKKKGCKIPHHCVLSCQTPSWSLHVWNVSRLKFRYKPHRFAAFFLNVRKTFNSLFLCWTENVDRIWLYKCSTHI